MPWLMTIGFVRWIMLSLSLEKSLLEIKCKECKPDPDMHGLFASWNIWSLKNCSFWTVLKWLLTVKRFFFETFLEQMVSVKGNIDKVINNNIYWYDKKSYLTMFYLLFLLPTKSSFLFVITCSSIDDILSLVIYRIIKLLANIIGDQLRTQYLWQISNCLKDVV